MSSELSVSAGEVRNFMVDPVWQFILEMLDDRIDTLHFDLEVAPNEAVFTPRSEGGLSKIDSVETVRGRIAEVRNFVRLPEVILGKLEEKTEETEDDNE